MDLKRLAQHVESVAGRAAVNQSEPDDDTGLVVVFDQSQQHYTHKEPCGAVVAALDLKGPTVREARAALANANAALPDCAKTLTVVEAAAILGVSKEKVYALCANGELRSTKVGRRVTIQRSELEKFRKRPATSQVKYRHLT